MDTRDAIVQNVCTYEILIKRKTQLDQLAEGLSPLGFTSFLSTLVDELKELFVGGISVTTEHILSLIRMVPEVPDEGVGVKTHQYLIRYITDLDEVGELHVMCIR